LLLLVVEEEVVEQMPPAAEVLEVLGDLGQVIQICRHLL